MSSEDAHLEASYEERHEQVDLSYSRDQEYAMDDMLDAELDEEEDDAPEPDFCDQDPCVCGNSCFVPEQQYGYQEVGDY